MTTKPFNNPASQAVKAAILKNDVRQNTLLGRAATELLMEERGRFARQAKITASEAAPFAYPGAPWTQNHLGQEAPLGFDVNAIEPVGEQFEIESGRVAWDRRDHDSAASLTSAAPAGAARSPQHPPSMSSAPANLQSKLWRRPL